MKPNAKAMNDKETVRITATLFHDQHERLEKLAKKNKVSVAWIVRRAVDRLIKEIDGGLKLPFEE